MSSALAQSRPRPSGRWLRAFMPACWIPESLPLKYCIMLPPDDALRQELHNELHARPTVRIQLPALVVQVAVLNEGVSREQELEHLRRLSGQGELHLDQLAGTFLRLRLAGGTLKWERHTEFTSYTLIQPLPRTEPTENGLLGGLVLDPHWLKNIPGRTIAAVELLMLVGEVEPPSKPLEQAQAWFGGQTVVASMLGRNGHSCAVTDFRLRPDGFERVVVVAPSSTSPIRAGRIAARLLELEAYRMMALRGWPVARSLRSMLREAERNLAGITSEMQSSARSDQELLDELKALAAQVEHAIAQHGYRFAASAAYQGIVQARLAELREGPISGTQTIGEFLQRRFAPAMATVESTAQRLAALSQRIERAGGLLRTRVDIALEQQNQQLLAKLSRGQELQLQLQRTVEGLSIAAITYYVVGLLNYLAKAAKEAGWPVQPELFTGLSIPVVMAGVWWLTRQIHHRLLTSQSRAQPLPPQRSEYRPE